MGCEEDPRCSPVNPYPCLNCSTTYLPCGGDCKPIKRKSDVNLADKKKWLNCCSYCIKTKSCGKVENKYLKSARYNDPHYLQTGKGCVRNIENKFLKDEYDRKKACDDYRKAIKPQKKLKRECPIEMTEKEKKRKEMKEEKNKKKECEKAQEKKENEKVKEIMNIAKQIELKEKKERKKKKERMEQEKKHNEKCVKRQKKISRFKEKMAEKADKRHKKEVKEELRKMEKKYKNQEKNKKNARAKTEKKQSKECKEERQRMSKLEKEKKKKDGEMKHEIEKLEAVQNKLDKHEQQEIDKLQKKMQREEKHQKTKRPKKKKIEKKTEKSLKEQEENECKKEVKKVKRQEKVCIEPETVINTCKKEMTKAKQPKNVCSSSSYDTKKKKKKKKKKKRITPKSSRYCCSGVCADAAKNKKVTFICKCSKKKQTKRSLFTPQCTNKTCVGVIPSPNSVGDGTWNKLSCLCKKVSMKLLRDHKVCEGGQCERARDADRENFLCKCLPVVTCVKSTCEKSNFKELAQAVHEKYEGMCKCGLKYKKIELQDAIDQTGEPAFEVRVRRGGLEIANLEEVQKNVKNLGKSRIPCTCPTFNRHLQHSIKNVCPTGACKTALTSKSISIDSKCESRKSKFCTEKTCLLKSNPVATPGRIINPQFSLNVDIDKNTILNSNEIQQRITNYQDKHKFCKFGRCRDALNVNEVDFICKCRSSSEICTDKTRVEDSSAKKHQKKNGKGKIECSPESCPMQGVSVTVGRKDKGYCDCSAENCHCPRWSRLSCIARFCCKQGNSLNKKLDSAGDGAYCCDKCQESNNEQSEELLERKEEAKTKTEVIVEEEAEKLTKGKATNEKQSTANTKATVKEEAKASTKAKATVKEDDIKLTKAKGTVKVEAIKQTIAKSRPKPNERVKETEEHLAKQKKLKELQMWENEEKLRIEEETAEGNVNLISSCISGLTSWICAILRKLISVLYRIVRHPILSFAYATNKLKNPKLTLRKTKRWGTLLYRSKMMRIKHNIDRSETGRAFTHELLTNKFVRLFLPKTKKMHDDLAIITESKRVKREATVRSCKHAFLLTLNKTPCLWLFYPCLQFYGPFLSCVAGFRRLMDALMAVGAIIVWTPCFVLVETCRFIFCCTICTV